MASESDGSDEFYDAEEITPGRKSRSGSKVAEKLETSSPTVTLSDSVIASFLTESDEFAEEEHFLELLKKDAEERRKKEDAELQKKVQSLERRRGLRDSDKKVSDLEKRRRKLQKLRQLVTEEGTSKRPQELMSDSRDDDLAERDPDDCDSDVISVNSDVSLTSSNRSNNSSQPGSGHNTMSGCQAATKVGFLATEKLFVDLESADRTLTDSMEIIEDIPSKELSGPEPDIIQSNKPRPHSLSDLPTSQPRPQSLPDIPTITVEAPPPKAPPRRKKKSQQPEEGATGGSGEASGAADGSIHSPTSTVLHLTKEFECALDMDGATSGQGSAGGRKLVQHRIVICQDNMSTKAETGDESSLSGNLVVDERVRPRSNSGSRYLTDQEILEQISVLNLDTGEKIPLSLAEDKLPQGVNPITLHIMRRTKEYSSDSSLHKACQSDDDDDEGTQSGDGTTQTLSRQAHKMKRKGLRMTKILGKKMGKTMTAIKHAAEEALNPDSESEDEVVDGKKQFKVRAARGHTGPTDFTNLKPVQDMSAGTGAVWTMKFSPCGRLLATGGQDNVLRVWVLKEALSYFDEMRQKYSESAARLSSAYSQDSLNSNASEYGDASSQPPTGGEEDDYKRAPFVRKPFCIYRGHTADLLDLSWSKNYFILSSSMDKTVRLWHISRRECLCCFQHIDFVTAIAFHPKDDRYFLSGSLDGKLRLWNIPDKKVALWNEVSGPTKLITAANFCQGGKFAVVGTYDGRCILYSTDQLKYYAQIFVRSTRGKNARGRKVTGVETLPNEDKILVSSNDSRLRLYDLRDLTLTCKYKGCVNNSSQIKASFSSNGKYIICGSEDYSIYVWRTFHESQKFSSVRRDRNNFWEAVRAHNAVVTAACFAPNPSLIIRPKSDKAASRDPETPRDDVRCSDGDVKPPRDADVRARDDKPRSDYLGEVLVSADFTGLIKVFKNRFRPVSTDDKR